MSSSSTRPADKVEEAYGFIAHNYLPGDEIFLFGFSRGAYTARMVAMFIGEIGVLDRTEMEHFARIFIDYQTLGKSTDKDEIATLHSRLAKWNQHDSPGRLRADYDEITFSVKCVGVFDTVGSLGLPEEFPLRSRRIKTLFGFPDRVLGDHIERAYQALALNEPRADFDCARFEQKPEGRAKGQILQQCWFTGCHSDIGGGYDEHDLADITLIWMAAQVGDMLALDSKYLAARIDPVAPWGMQSPHDPMTGVFMLAHTIQRQLPEGINDVTREVIHSSVLEQSSLYPSVRSLIEKVPELISPLFPLEEEMKVNWPYKPPATLPAATTAAATTTTTTTTTTIQTNVTVAVASSGGSSVIATGPKPVLKRTLHVVVDNLLASDTMAVKDLAEHYESLSAAQNSPSSSTNPGTRRPYSHRNSDDISHLLPNSPARFLTHTSKRTSVADDNKQSYDVVPPETSVDITGAPAELDSSTGVPPSASNLTPSFLGTEGTTILPSLLGSHTRSVEYVESSPDKSDTATLVERPRFPPHVPIPATTLFARSASPLSLPKLDDYLSRLHVPSFVLRGRQAGDSQIFPPMEKLAVPVTNVDLVDSWRQLFLGTIPNLVALNFASGTLGALIYLVILMVITAGLLYHFYRSTPLCDRYNTVEGLQLSQPKDGRWGIVITTFLLTLIYLPLSTMAVNVLVWSEDLWAVPNYYRNATSFPPVVAPLGPPEEYREPLDFCWTTTMKKNEVNFAPLIIIISFLAFAGLTVWFPIALRKVIQRSVPRVDPYTELGRRRNSGDMDREYHRLLSRDRNAFAFLYGGFRRGWGTYESTYLLAKLSTLFIVAVINSDNCLFRGVSRTWLPIARQVILLVSTIVFFVMHCILVPFLDPVNNASEWVSRVNYLITAGIALANVFEFPGKDIITSYILYIVYVITYGFTIYFLIINMSVVHRWIKRLSRRVDFSIDVFSPWLDLSPSSLHVKRRIWQETLTTLILTASDCKIPEGQAMMFAQARDLEYPPYLLDFAGTPAERHVENMKILREIGSLAYTKGVSLTSGPDHPIYAQIAAEIQANYIGPDCYWKPDTMRPHCRSFFGNAWWVPFPPSLVLKYDDGPLTVLQAPKDLERYISQNLDPDIRQRRDVRLALRALDGQVVNWPYCHTTDVGANTVWSCRRQRYKANVTLHFHTCTLVIKRKGQLDWHGVPLGSGFDVELVYSTEVRQPGTLIGLTEDFDLTPPLARFLTLNRDIIDSRLDYIERELGDYKTHHEAECRYKRDTLTYGFLTNVYDQPQAPSSLVRWIRDHEKDVRIGQLLVQEEQAISMAYERVNAVSESEAASWWYIFWDDFWRQNHDAIPALNLHASDFNPHYPTSIAYTPLPRANLEAFLIQRGLMSGTSKPNGYLHHGFLNKIYIRLNEAVFHDSPQAVLFHLGIDGSEMNMSVVDENLEQPSTTFGTGGGTDHDDISVRPRPTYRWEGLLMDEVQERKPRRKGLFVKLKAWLGLNPIWRSGSPSKGISLDVRLHNGRYVLLSENVDD
ncbi:hypothetical protein ONZ45_g7784 [Pleurotus djamor]|nr:hypothetical protein ONZ45_g7784 [Pleurotus djamor]